MNIDELLQQNSGIRLDIGCGASKQPNFVGIDVRPLEGVDIVHDLECLPWPLPDECVLVAVCSHVVEHINPHRFGFVNFMNELWRVMKPGGEIAIACPHGSSQGFLQDPTHCLLDGAEVLTENGFKNMKDIAIGERVLTLNIESGTTEYANCISVINEPYKGEILRFKNRATHIAVTPSHDLVWRTWQPIKGFHKSPANTFENVGAFARRGLRTIPDWSGDSGVSGDFMELLGWIISEGSFVQRGSYKRILVHQSPGSNLEKYNRIACLVSRIGMQFRENKRDISVKNDELFDELSVLGKSHQRYIPLKYKNQNPELLGRLLESMILGDGEKHPNGNGYTITTVSSTLAKDINEIAVKCGLNSTISVRQGGKFVSPGTSKVYVRKNQYRVSVRDNRPMVYPEPTRESYEGDIVCVQVDKNNTILTRYDGFIAWTGNCNPINETTFAYFDPTHPSGLYRFYTPKPWKIKYISWNPAANIEVVLVKMKEDESDRD